MAREQVRLGFGDLATQFARLLQTLSPIREQLVTAIPFCEPNELKGRPPVFKMCRPLNQALYGGVLLLRAIALLLTTAAVLSLCCFAENPRVFVTDSKSWEISGSSGGSSGSFGGHVSGGARPQTAEIIKTFGERCKDVTINNKQEKADYVVVLDHEGGKGFVRKDNKVAVFNSDGDSIVSRSTRSLGSAVEDACTAVEKDWAANSAKPKPSAVAIPAPVTTKTAPEMQGKIQISSQPASADIEIDGAFVGNTPSSVQLAPGEHKIIVKKDGFKDWSRVVKVSNGDVNVSAELQKNE